MHDVRIFMYLSVWLPPLEQSNSYNSIKNRERVSERERGELILFCIHSLAHIILILIIYKYAAHLLDLEIIHTASTGFHSNIETTVAIPSALGQSAEEREVYSRTREWWRSRDGPQSECTRMWCTQLV